MTGQSKEEIGGRHVARGVGTTMLARMGALVEVVSQPIYVAMFGLAGFGLYAVLWSAVNLLENIFDLGMTSALQRTVPQAKDDSEALCALRAALLVGVLPCAAVACIIFLYAPQIAPLLNVRPEDEALLVPAVRLFVWALPLWALVEVATSAVRARHVFGAEIRLRIFWEQLIRLVLALVFWGIGWGLSGLFIAHMCSLLATAMLSIRLLARHYPLRGMGQGRWFGSMFVQTAQAGLAVLPANVLARLFGDAPTIILNQLLPGAAGAKIAGLFTIGRKISSIVQVVRTAFVYVLAPLASSALRNDIAQVRAIYGYATRLITVIVLPLAMVLSGGVLPLLAMFGTEARGARVAVLLLIAGRALEAVVGISVPVQQVASTHQRQIVASLSGFVIACIAGWMLVGFDALGGVSAAVAIGLVSAALIPMIQLWRFDHIQPFDAGFLRLLGISLLGGAGGMALALLSGALPNWIALPLLPLLAGGAIWASARLALSAEDRHSLGKTGRRMRLV